MEHLGEDVELASVPLRALAFFLDSAIVIVILMTIGSLGLASGVQVGTALPAMIAVLAAYNIGFVAATGATPGKTAVGLRIVGRDGERPRPDTAVLRFLVYFALGALFPLGTVANLASVFADHRRRSFADRIAGTLVLQDAQPDRRP
jgi:uncharacterized RDD family membrane protein YckC